MGRKQANNSMTNLVNQMTNGDEQKRTEVINATFQSVSSGRLKLMPTHQHPASYLPNKYCVSIEEVEKKMIYMATQVRKSTGLDEIPN